MDHRIAIIKLIGLLSACPPEKKIANNGLTIKARISGEYFFKIQFIIL